MVRQICSFLKNLREVGKMRHRFEDSFNMNILNWKLYGEINSVRTWSSRKVDFCKWNYVIFAAKIWTRKSFMTLQRVGFKCFAKIIQVVLVLTLQATLNIFVHDVINLLHYEHWTDRRKYFHIYKNIRSSSQPLHSTKIPRLE